MKLSASPFVVTVWMPTMFILGVYLFFHGMAPEYWLIALPLVLVVFFMTTLAEVHDQGHQIRVKLLWHSMDVPKQEVVGIAQSFVKGVGVLRLRRFVFPWGRIYFVIDWSRIGVVRPGPENERSDAEAKPYHLARAVLDSILMAISGFIAARAMRVVPNLGLETSTMRIGAFTLAGALCVVFAMARTRSPSFANVLLFVATFIAGLALWWV